MQESSESLGDDKYLVDINISCHANGGIPFFQVSFIGILNSERKLSFYNRLVV